MNYSILTDTDFFGLIGENGSGNIDTVYKGFVETVIKLCCEYSDQNCVAVALAYAENELQYHQALQLADNDMNLYVRKALSFVRKMQKQVSTHPIPIQVPLSSSPFPNRKGATPAPVLQWTGNAIDLVEIIYGINEMGCINDGNTPLKDLAATLYSFFGVDSKDCYRFYTDIKRRKNESRTYFLDKMQERLNEKMRRDDELERMRR